MRTQLASRLRQFALHLKLALNADPPTTAGLSLGGRAGLSDLLGEPW